MSKPALFLFSLCLIAQAPRTPAELFQTDKVWTIHMKFTADQWAAIEPKGGPGGPGAPVMVRMGPGGRGGPGFGIGNLLAGSFLNADADGNRQLSAAEFTALASQWFAEWDTKKSGALGPEELRAGTAKLFEAAIGRMMGGGPGPRGPGGPGGPNGFVAPKGKRNGLSGAMGIEFEYVHADIDFNGQSLTNVAVRYKGNGTFMQSRNSEKKSFKLDLNEFNKTQKLAGVTKLNLHNAVTDASWMNEVLSYRLYRDAGLPASRSSYARVYISVPGKYERKYFGLYSIVEEVDNNFALENYKTKEGLFLKPATRDIFGYLGDNWDAYEQPYDPKGKPTPAQKKRVIDFARLLTKGSDEEFRAQAPAFLNVPQMARYMAVTVWLSTLDSILGMGQNYYLYLNPKTNQFELLPWDLDHSFGQFNMAGSQEQREGLSILQPWQGQVRFLERLYGLPEFRKEYLDRMTEYQKSIFNPARFVEQVDALAKAIRPGIADESPEKLARFDKVTAGESVPPAPMGFGPPPGPGGFAGPGGPGRPGGPGAIPVPIGPAGPGGFAGPGDPGGPGGPNRAGGPGAFTGPIGPDGPGGPGRPAGPGAFSGPGAPGGPGGSGGPGGFRGPGPIPGFGAPAKPIKAFVGPRHASVADQLAGKSKGHVRTGLGFGPGGPGGPGGRGPSLERAFLDQFDTDKNGSLSPEEFRTGFARWFSAWNADNSGQLTEPQLRDGINRDLNPMRGPQPF